MGLKSCMHIIVVSMDDRERSYSNIVLNRENRGFLQTNVFFCEAYVELRKRRSRPGITGPDYFSFRDLLSERAGSTAVGVGN